MKRLSTRPKEVVPPNCLEITNTLCRNPRKICYRSDPDGSRRSKIISENLPFWGAGSLMLHKAVVVTSRDEQILTAAHVQAQKMFRVMDEQDPDRLKWWSVSDLVRSAGNGYQSFFIAPGGEPEDVESDDEDAREHFWKLDEFMEWMADYTFEHQCVARLEWGMVEYGHDLNLLRDPDEDELV